MTIVLGDDSGAMYLADVASGSVGKLGVDSSGVGFPRYR